MIRLGDCSIYKEFAWIFQEVVDFVSECLSCAAPIQSPLKQVTALSI